MPTGVRKRKSCVSSVQSGGLQARSACASVHLPGEELCGNYKLSGCQRQSRWVAYGYFRIIIICKFWRESGLQEHPFTRSLIFRLCVYKRKLLIIDSLLGPLSIFIGWKEFKVDSQINTVETHGVGCIQSCLNTLVFYLFGDSIWHLVTKMNANSHLNWNYQASCLVWMSKCFTELSRLLFTWTHSQPGSHRILDKLYIQFGMSVYYRLSV